MCHLPPGTSKWNKIENRLKPIAATTNTGLTVHTELDTNTYPTGVTISNKQVTALPIIRHTFHGDWNYTPNQ